MNGAPEFRALIAPRYSFTTWWSMVRFRAPSAFLTLMPVNAFDRLSTSWTLVGGYPRWFIVSRMSRTVLRQDRSRSEEHTSELQSPCNLVCCLLLEKKI